MEQSISQLYIQKEISKPKPPSTKNTKVEDKGEEFTSEQKRCHLWREEEKGQSQFQLLLSSLALVGLPWTSSLPWIPLQKLYLQTIRERKRMLNMLKIVGGEKQIELIEKIGREK